MELRREKLQRCELFNGLNDAQLQYALRFFAAAPERYEKGEFLKSAGEPLHRFGLVLEGTVQVCMDELDGRQMIMANVPAGGTFGESLCYLQTPESPVYILAESRAEVLWLRLDATRALSKTADPRDFELVRRFTEMLARRALLMNDRIQILSKGTLREKLLTFFLQWECRTEKRDFRIPFDRAGLALYLGVNRSALSRELSSMRDDGLLEFEHNWFRLTEKIAKNRDFFSS